MESFVKLCKHVRYFQTTCVFNFENYKFEEIEEDCETIYIFMNFCINSYKNGIFRYLQLLMFVLICLVFSSCLNSEIKWI